MNCARLAQKRVYAVEWFQYTIKFRKNQQLIQKKLEILLNMLIFYILHKKWYGK